MTLSALCLLAGCGGSTFAELAPPPSLTAPCPGPTALPDRGLSATEIELYWGRDRGHLRQCAGQLAGLAGWVAQDAGLSKIEQKHAAN
jgi:hypothetical protein